MRTRLKDTYIPNVDRDVLLKKLLKLPLDALCELTLLWLNKFSYSGNRSVKEISRTLDLLQQTKARRRVLAKQILFEYWPNGLNLFQIAQVDCYILINKENNNKWVSSTAWKSNKEKFTLNIDPEELILDVQKELSKFYFSSLYIFRYPSLPLVVCRIQLYDLNNSFLKSISDKTRNKNSDMSTTSIDIDKSVNKDLISRQPFYVAIPDNSSTLIHSADRDTYAQMIMQSIQKAVSKREHIIFKSDNDPPVKSLHSINILKGISRDSNSLGPWSVYSKGSFDISPLNNITKHISVKGKRTYTETDASDDEEFGDIKRIRLENNFQRFKGHFSDQLDNYQDKTTYYKSLVPIEKISFTLKNTLPGTDDDVSINFKLQGNDIFGGLHELADKKLVNSAKVPGWLTGENGISSGTIVNGDFIKSSRSKGGLL
ncbi:hypothetical protein TPHA_0L01360 [Tetrapisispora phaffii CBS 4417]|uniref:Uncharacterized protein n=1 Tax=Tetrapisispora phaffii (strain ATCC 24235 / CBS 4417 / NBRC 1672 / NRRL Y-8282 / UCD 70-5) TaxID=1071381 RepID=G8C013_TETPH|nr:hypothetical protein TPHA_0L01360 [Tetrapisispora phaffii CBS 4417]CCE65491.1 hypothetical protein TPHA_0L01360 [Tetrapisispora phaffii CBS 4417]